MERLLDEISFEGPELAEKAITIDARLRPPHARRHRQERRPVPLHPVTVCRATTRALIVSCVAAGGLRQEGPPLPPLQRIPVAPPISRWRGSTTTSTCSSRSRPSTSTASGRRTSRASRSMPITADRAPQLRSPEALRRAATLVASEVVRSRCRRRRRPRKGSRPRRRRRQGQASIRARRSCFARR